MKKLRLFLLALALGLSLSLPLSAESFYRISETQLQELEANSKAREAELENLKNSLSEMKSSIQKSEAKNLKNEILIGGISFSVGFAAGAVTMLVYLYNK